MRKPSSASASLHKHVLVHTIARLVQHTAHTHLPTAPLHCTALHAVRLYGTHMVCVCACVHTCSMRERARSKRARPPIMSSDDPTDACTTRNYQPNRMQLFATLVHTLTNVCVSPTTTISIGLECKYRDYVACRRVNVRMVHTSLRFNIL